MSSAAKKIREYTRNVTSILAKKGDETGETGADRPVKKMFFRLSMQEQMMFAKRLSILLRSGIPILQAVDMVKRQSQSRSARDMLADLSTGVEGGQFLYVRLEKYRKYLGNFAVNIIRIGEVSGTLHENLAYLADEIRKKKELRRKVVSALVYPAFIVLATIGVTILLLTYVFPKILPIFAAFSSQLPASTRLLIFISNLFIHWGWLIALILVALIGVFILALRKNSKFALFVDRMLLKIPVLGMLLQYYNMANFCRTLGVLLQSSVRIVEAVNITATTTTNLVYHDSLLRLGNTITQGGRISGFLEEEGKIYPPMVSQMINVGETTGKLSDSLVFLSDMYENEVDELTKNLSTSIEPLLMIFMGLLVGFVAISIITPIYSFTQNLTPFK